MFFMDKTQIIVMVIGALLTPVFIVVFQKHKVPKTLPLLPPSDDGFHPFPDKPRDMYEHELEQLGFRYLGDFDTTMSHRTRMVTRAYLSHDGLHAAAVSLATNVEKKKKEEKKVFEFSTALQPKGSITTSMRLEANVLRWPTEKVVIAAPWKKTTEELLELQLQLTKVATSLAFTPRKINPTEFVEEFREEIREDFEAQVRFGRMRKTGDDEYALSFIGALIAIPKVIWHTVFGFVKHSLHPSNEDLCEEARYRLQAARQGL